MVTQVGSALETDERRLATAVDSNNVAIVSLLDGGRWHRCHDNVDRCSSHVDITDVQLVAINSNSTLTGLQRYGLVIGPHSTDDKRPVISYIEPGGIAERCGQLAEGDRVVSINGWSLRGHSIDDVNDMMSVCRHRLTLRIEFDVADCLVTKDGTYQIKLMKRADGIGISISCPKNRRPGHPLVISDVRKGSVAHRTGAISAGDYLLAIDDVWLENYTLEETAHLLLSTEQIVKLRIQKNESYADDRPAAITFNVELPTYLGRLGIVLVQTTNNTIVVGQIIDDCLADKTGALCVGDHVTAINNIPLDGCSTVDDVVRILSTLDRVDSVNIKIRRQGRRKESLLNDQTTTTAAINIDDVLADVCNEFNCVASWTRPTDDRRLTSTALSDVTQQDDHVTLSSDDEQSVSLAVEYSPTGIEQIVTASIYRKSADDGFGFSLSTSLDESGVFVGAVKDRGPAVDKLRPFDRLLQVNDTQVFNMLCSDIVSLISQTGNQLHLVVSRRLATTVLDSGNRGDDEEGDVTSATSSGFSERHQNSRNQRPAD
jgi:C-terminal processing protease CtpA/Prc